MKSLYFNIRDDAVSSEISSIIFKLVKDFVRNNPTLKTERGQITYVALHWILRVIESEKDLYQKTIERSSLVKLKVQEYLGIEDDTFEIKLKL